MPKEERHAGGPGAPFGRGDGGDRPRRLAGRCILVVKDQAVIAMLIEETLREAGASVALAPDGRGALAWAGRVERLDAAVLDLWPPDMDGAEAARRLRAMRPGLPVVFESGAAPAAAARVVAGGPTAFLLKPFDPTELVGAIAHLIETAARGQRNGPPPAC